MFKLILALFLVTMVPTISFAGTIIHSNQEQASFNTSMCVKLFKHRTTDSRGSMIDYCRESGSTEGSEISQTILGQIYSVESIAGKQDFKEAAYWYEKASNQGNIPSSLRLARILMEDHDGLNKDLVKAKNILEKAYRYNKDMDAPYYLAALIMLKKEPTIEDVVMACKYSVISSRMGSEKGSLGFQTIVKNLYKIDQQSAEKQINECKSMAEKEMIRENVFLIDKQSKQKPVKVYSGPKSIHSPDFWLDLLVD